MLTQFLRLSHFFRGDHRVEEIMWSAQAAREIVVKVLSAYADILVVTLQAAHTHKTHKHL